MAAAGHEWDPFFGPPVRAGGPPPSWKRGAEVTFNRNGPPSEAPRVAWPDQGGQPPVLPRHGSHHHTEHNVLDPYSPIGAPPQPQERPPYQQLVYPENPSASSARDE